MKIHHVIMLVSKILIAGVKIMITYYLNDYDVLLVVFCSFLYLVILHYAQKIHIKIQ
jgi:hypothetical protein